MSKPIESPEFYFNLAEQYKYLWHDTKLPLWLLRSMVCLELGNSFLAKEDNPESFSQETVDECFDLIEMALDLSMVTASLGDHLVTAKGKK